jgi:hypothetical protein
VIRPGTEVTVHSPRVNSCSRIESNHSANLLYCEKSSLSETVHGDGFVFIRSWSAHRFAGPANGCRHGVSVLKISRLRKVKYDFYVGHRIIHSSPIPGITDKDVEWSFYCTTSLYLTTMSGCASIKSYPLYSLIVQVASILKCNDTHRIRRKDSHHPYRHHVCYSSYVLCGSAHCFLRGLTTLSYSIAPTVRLNNRG